MIKVRGDPITSMNSFYDPDFAFSASPVLAADGFDIYPQLSGGLQKGFPGFDFASSPGGLKDYLVSHQFLPLISRVD
jgi:hypothetical protein